MHLVDLAGSERVALSGVEGDTLVETQNINLSLTAIGDVLSALSRNAMVMQQQHRSLQGIYIYTCIYLIMYMYIYMCVYIYIYMYIYIIAMVMQQHRSLQGIHTYMYICAYYINIYT
jgi:hypothetical protein